VQEVVKPALQQGSWVLCDRYSDSTLAYQLAARGLAESMDLQPMLTFAEAGCTPQQTFWLDVSANTALKRVRSRTDMGAESTRLDEEALSFHERVHEAFLAIFQQYPERMVRLDATVGIEDVQQQIQSSLIV